MKSQLKTQQYGYCGQYDIKTSLVTVRRYAIVYNVYVYLVICVSNYMRT